MGVIYTATNQVNGKQYVGKSLRSLRVRQFGHRRAARGGYDSVFARAMRKYGLDSFSWRIIFEGDVSDADLCQREMTLIVRLNTRVPNGYNMTAGGEGFKGNHSEKTKVRLSEVNKGKVISEEQKRAISRANKGRKLPPMSKSAREKISLAMKGRKLTLEWKRKISLANTGRSRKSVSEETRKKLSNAHKGRKKSAEHLANIGKALKGRRPVKAIQASAEARRGKPLSLEHKEKLRRASIGKRLSVETCKKIGDVHRGMRHTEETKRRIRLARACQTINHSDETKAKIAASVKASWYKSRGLPEPIEDRD